MNKSKLLIIAILLSCTITTHAFLTRYDYPTNSRPYSLRNTPDLIVVHEFSPKSDKNVNCVLVQAKNSGSISVSCFPTEGKK